MVFLMLGNKPLSKTSNIQLDSEAVRTKTIETHWNEWEKYLKIIHFPFSLSSKPLFRAEFQYTEKGLFLKCIVEKPFHTFLIYLNACILVIIHFDRFY